MKISLKLSKSGVLAVGYDDGRLWLVARQIRFFITGGTPLDSMREAVFTVSPNKQYRGIFRPTTPAHTGPVWIPMRKSNLLSGRCLILNSDTAFSKWRDIEAISAACISLLRIGNPETTIYASPIVSTL
uniref:Uncharacterized protein n=1 Tax=Glossina palpalis gambiensis TaxID=67801 RepID=A0A1B0AQX5_9MUSC